MPIEKSGRRVSSARLVDLGRALLDASALCAIATVDPRNRAHVNTAYFAYTPSFEIVWISEPAARHSLNLSTNRTAAVAVFDSRQRWGRPDRGIQLFGTATLATRRTAGHALDAYKRRFTKYDRSQYTAYVPYLFRPRRMKLFDEAMLGSGIFVTCSVGKRGDVAWETSEVYTPS